MGVELSLADKVVALHDALTSADVPHAFGGAIALAYYAEPRATIDVDLNIFLPPEDRGAVEAALIGLGLAPELTAVERDGQARIRWGRTPLDLFFSYLPFHDAMREKLKVVPFGNATIPILAAEHLVVCKALFDRPKDWLDIEQVAAAGAGLDADEVVKWMREILSESDPRTAHVRGMLGGP